MSTASKLQSKDIWCVFRMRNGPTMLGIFVGIDSSNGVPLPLILGVDEKLYRFSPAVNGDVFFHHFNRMEQAVMFFKEVEKPAA